MGSLSFLRPPRKPITPFLPVPCSSELPDAFGVPNVRGPDARWTDPFPNLPQQALSEERGQPPARSRASRQPCLSSPRDLSRPIADTFGIRGSSASTPRPHKPSPGGSPGAAAAASLKCRHATGTQKRAGDDRLQPFVKLLRTLSYPRLLSALLASFAVWELLGASETAFFRWVSAFALSPILL